MMATIAITCNIFIDHPYKWSALAPLTFYLGASRQCLVPRAGHGRGIGAGHAASSVAILTLRRVVEQAVAEQNAKRFAREEQDKLDSH